jgi:hypothetical protein
MVSGVEPEFDGKIELDIDILRNTMTGCQHTNQENDAACE